MLPWSQIARLGGACGALLLAACVEQPKRNRPSKKLAPKPKPTRECQEGESCFIPKENFQKLYSQVLKNGATHPVQTIDTDGNPTLFKLPSHLKAILEIGKYWDEVSSGKIEQIDGVIDTENVSEETIRIQPNDQVQRWLPTKRHLFRTSKSSVSLNFSDAVSGEALSCASAVVWHVVANPKGDGFLNYFVTNEHVIGDIGKITEVVDVDGRECRVTLKNVTAVGKAKDWFGNETEFKIDRILMKKKKPDLGVFVEFLNLLKYDAIFQRISTSPTKS
jgi:hypothetical protein